MTWVRLDDRYDEETAHLTHQAFRLFTTMLTFSRRNHRGGELDMVRDVKPLARKLGIRNLGPVLAELTAETDADPPLCLQVSAQLHVRNYDRFNPPSSLERVRHFRAEQRRRIREQGDVTVTRNGERVTETDGNAASRARQRAGSPKPIPTTTPTGVVGNGAVNGTAHRQPSVEVPGDDTPALVAAWHDAVVEYGAIPNRKLLPRVGQAVKQLLGEGHDAGVVRTALRELARRNEQPGTLAYLVGDVERDIAGTPMGRVRAASITATQTRTETPEARAEREAQELRSKVLALLASGDEVDPSGWRPEQRDGVRAAIAEWNQRA